MTTNPLAILMDDAQCGAYVNSILYLFKWSSVLNEITMTDRNIEGKWLKTCAYSWIDYKIQFSKIIVFYKFT